MPRNSEMTWVGSQNRWTKFYKGKRYYIGCKELGTQPTKEASSTAANRWWASKQAELDNQEGAQERGLLALASDKVEELATVDAQAGILQSLLERLQGVTQPDLQALLANAYQGKAAAVSAAPVPPAKTIRPHAEGWKALQRSRPISKTRAVMNCILLDKFLDWFGLDSPCSAISESTVQGFYSWLCGQQAAYSQDYQRKIWNYTKAFLKHLYENRAIDGLPRNLESNLFTFTSQSKPVQVFTVQQVKALYAESRGQSRLHVLLFLNCGFTPKDCADLTDNQVDWKAGTITRVRSKRQHDGTAKRVTWKLWPETFRLLKEHRSGGQVVLLTKSGQPWITEALTADDYKRSSSFASNFREAKKRAGLKEGNLKMFRATAASMLASHPQFKFYAGYFLAHSAKGVTEKHYAEPSQAEFFAALDWLRGQFAL